MNDTQNAVKHTPQFGEPWEVYYDAPEHGMVQVLAHDLDNGTFAVCDTGEYYAERIKSAVNAVAGIPTEALECGVVGEMVEALDTFMRGDWSKLVDIALRLEPDNKHLETQNSHGLMQIISRAILGRLK
jgi:hypothetical protein